MRDIHNLQMENPEMHSSGSTLKNHPLQASQALKLKYAINTDNTKYPGPKVELQTFWTALRKISSTC